MPATGLIVINFRGFASENYQMKNILFVILALTLPLSAIAAEGFSSLEEQMSGKEYKATGLDKLTPEELEALNSWIRRHSVATLDQPKGGSYVAATGVEGDTRGFKNKKDTEEDKSSITSQVKGSFDGWNGHTVFTLENGMIWEQSDNDKFYIKEVQNAEIIIEHGMFGTWRLSMVGFNSSCRVKRVQ